MYKTVAESRPPLRRTTAFLSRTYLPAYKQNIIEYILYRILSTLKQKLVHLTNRDFDVIYDFHFQDDHNSGSRMIGFKQTDSRDK